MADTPYTDTIDWDRFWTNPDADDRASAMASRHHVVDLLTDFVDAKGVPDSMADVGCGDGHVCFELTDEYPAIDAVGYDAAEPVLEEARERARNRSRERAREEDQPGITFEQATLQDFDPGRQFDLVLCHATLDYVADAETAVNNLYDTVEIGGYLVLQYPSRLGRAHRQRVLDEPERFMEDPDDFDADRFAERFQLVLDGENLLSYERIHDVLGTWPRSLWEVVDKPEEPWAWRHFPTVWVPK